MRTTTICLLALFCPLIATAHDAWMETNPPLVRPGDVVHIDLKLGNHGNDHRDFKLAGKVSLDPCQIFVVGPTGESFDLKPQLIDTGLSPKEGYWTGRYTTSEPGMHLVGYTVDNLRGKTRSIKSAKSYFHASKRLDEIPENQPGFDKPLGHPLEIMPLTNPVTAMGAGQPIQVRLFLRSKPLSDARVSFIPRGALLEDGFDKRFERQTNAEGVATYTPREGNIILIVVHHAALDEHGDGFDSTNYSATMTISVPQLCPHCTKALLTR